MDKIKLIALLLVGLAVGYLLPREHSPVREEPGEQATVRTYQAAPRQPRIEPAQAQRAPVKKPASPEFEDLLEQPSIFATLHLAYQMAAGADQERLERLATEALLQDDPLLRMNIADIFVEKMIALDVEQALSFAESLPNGEQRNYLIASVLNSWVRSDEEAAFGYYQSISNMQLKQTVAASFMRDITRSDAFQDAVQTELGPYGAQLAQSIRLSREPPDEAFRNAQQAPPGLERRQIFGAALRWFREDPDAALAEVAAMAPSQQRSQLLGSMLSELGSRDPQQAMELANLYAPDDPHVQQMALQRYASNDPEAALPLVEEYTRRTGNTNVMSQTLASWVTQNPQAAIEYAESLPRHQQTQALHNMLMTYTRENPREGLEWALRLQDAGNNVAQVAFYNLTPEGSEIAESMLDEISDEKARNAVIHGLAESKSRNDPQSALRWLERYQDEPGYSEIYANTLQNWANRNPVAAAAELSGRWDDEALSESFRQVTWAWAYRDPDAALNWTRDLPDSPARDAAIASMVEVTAHRDPEQAIALFEELPAGEQRERAAAVIAGAMSDGDPERMRENMLDLGISEDTIDSFIRVWYR